MHTEHAGAGEPHEGSHQTLGAGAPWGCKIILVTGFVDLWITMEEAAISPSSLGTVVGGTQFSYRMLGRDPVQLKVAGEGPTVFFGLFAVFL